MAAWRFSRSKSSGRAALSQTAPLSRTQTVGGLGCLVAFFLLFALAGLGVLIPFFVMPSLQVIEARGWQPVACTILSSSVKVSSSSDSDTSEISVRYRYQLDGRTYTSDRYQFFNALTSGYDRKQKVVDGLPPGSETLCYVDPDDPDHVVIERGFTLDYLFGLLPLPFAVIGLGGLMLLIRGYRRSKDPRKLPESKPASWLPRAWRQRQRKEDPSVRYTLRAEDAGLSSSEAPLVLETSIGPAGKFFAILFGAAFWNGIVGVFVWHWVKDFRAGEAEGCTTIFLIPFVLVGLLLLAGIPYQFLALFNPRPHLTLSRGAIPLGESARLDWAFSGAPGRIRRLVLRLEGREEATYRQGTDTSTAKSVFAKLTLKETTFRPEIASGTVTIEIPADTMHSFEAAHNKIVWVLKVEGEIAMWPDITEEFPITILPAESSLSSRFGAER